MPPEAAYLTSLRVSGLDGNQLTALPPEIGRFTKLRSLYLDDNQLTELPPEIGNLTRLQTLSVRRNQLTALPPEIGNLTILRELNLEDNQLTMLPWQLADLLGRELNPSLDGNPLLAPIPELAERGTAELAAYLLSFKNAIPQYEAKVLLVGEGNVGKTSLIAAISNEQFVQDRPTTHGIEIRPLIVHHPSAWRNIVVRAWDFGGQEVYRVTHQFFFSKRALYLVVWNAREGQEQNEVEGWLRRIRLRVSHDSRALVVATHCDERSPELDYPRLRQLFPEFLVDRYEVDNRTGRGIDQLRDGIASQAARLPQMGQLISSQWVAARNEILARADSAPQIPYEEFTEICQRNQINDYTEISTLAQLLHDLGHIVYYSEDKGLRDFVVLNPEWLTKAISYVLEDVPTRQAEGVLDHTRLKEIWQDRPDGTSYPARYHPYFLRLMEKYDISYRLEDDQDSSLIAQLVPHERSNLPWAVDSPLPGGIRSLTLICQLSEPVPGLIPWLTVRHHRASTKKNWRNGVFLRHPIGAYASEALVELATPDQLVMEVRAPSPDMFFNVLRDSIEDLMARRWPGLKYKLLIPCPTRADGGQRCHGKFPLDGLLRYREQNGVRAHCWDCDKDHDTTELLTGFALPDQALKPQLKQLKDQVDNVVSGVNRMEEGINRLECYAAATADSMRRLLRAASIEVTDCPRLFTLIPKRRGGARALMWGFRPYRLMLWCEHPAHWHPLPAAAYSLAQPRRWLAEVGPYLIVVFRTLQLVVPIAASVANVALTDEQIKHAKHEVELMKTIVSSLPNEEIQDYEELITYGDKNPLTPAEGHALRGLRHLILERDPGRAFGGLRRVLASSGEYLWVCSDHYPEYDPGLPFIPERHPGDS